MPEYEEKGVELDCPYCGETIELMVDCSQREQDYVEDCQVCCKPMDVHASVDNGGTPSVTASRQDER